MKGKRERRREEGRERWRRKRNGDLPGLAEGPPGDIAGATGLIPIDVVVLLPFEVEVEELVAARSLLPRRARADELNVPAFVQISSTLRTFSCNGEASG